jgi:hypothetical protein
MHLRDIGRNIVDWIDIIQDNEQRKAPVNTAMNLGF